MVREREIDRVAYDGGPTFPNPDGASMMLIQPDLDNALGANWRSSTGSLARQRRSDPWLTRRAQSGHTPNIDGHRDRHAHRDPNRNTFADKHSYLDGNGNSDAIGYGHARRDVRPKHPCRRARLPGRQRRLRRRRPP